MELSKESLLCLPTPLHRLERLSALIGVEVWIKRDDLTGFAMGGNKGRKLEYLMADAKAVGADCIVACGAQQSNHARQTAAAASHIGLQCYLTLLGSDDSSGNVLLERIAGAHIRFVGGDLWNARDPGMWDYLHAQTEALAERLKNEGRRPYLIPVGGSTPIGATGFAAAVRELQAQCGEPFDEILFASSSGGTQAGLTVGVRQQGLATAVVGVAADPEDIRPELVPVANGLAGRLGMNIQFTEEDFLLERGYVGPGYALQSREANEAIRVLAKMEGIYLDPVYSGKAMAGLIGLAAAGRWRDNQRVLFWHTGGVPTLFASDYQVLD